MGIYLLDSNVCIDLLRDPFGKVAQNIANHKGTGNQIVTSRIVQYELELGAHSSSRPDEGLANIKRILSDGISVLDFDAPATHAAAKLSRQMQGKGFNLQAYEALIAGHAIALGATLVTSDARLAGAVSEVGVVSWR
jgi:tRNA(fMet)-specific endonuclease VapC